MSSAQPADGAGQDPAEREERRTVGAVLVGAALLRIVAVIGQQAFVYVDSADYEVLDFSGRARRPWVTPLLYSLTDSTAIRIVLQASIGAACWSFLAVVASSMAEDRRARWAILLSILGLSLTTTVTNWDTAMLSESMALSLTALLLATLLRVAQRRTTAAVVAAVGAWALWIFTRQNHLVLAVLVVATVAVLIAVGWARRRVVDRVLALLLAGFVLVGLLAASSYRSNTEIIDFNVATVLGARVLPDAGDAAWFHDHGMPAPADVPAGAAASPEQLLDDPTFAAWLHEDGVRTYGRFLAVHPWATLTRPLEGFVSDRAPFGDAARADEVLLAGPDSYGVGREVIPEPVEDLLFQPGSAGTVVFALVAVVALTVRRWRDHGPDGRWLVPLVALGLQWPALTAVWHASVAELSRLALPSVVVIRVAIVLQLALLTDAWLRDRRAVEPGGLEPLDGAAADPA
jgi:hypothetical protein